jgi:hypothetical protein
MIPTATTLTEVDNLPGEEVPFTIGNPVWVMKNLAKLYSDTSTAVIREYSTNAVDSHIMAGKGDVPIEVTLPSIYDPYFVVTDHGLGMSKRELEEVYTSFGDSTKRETNDVNGMYGFGSKSAVAYTNQFTVVGVKDGIETHAVITKKPDYSMTLKVVHQRLTDGQDGVKIKIPVHNIDEFVRKAKDFYRFWLPGTVLVNGYEPTQAVGEKIDESLYFSPNPGVSYVVMGNVGYRIHNPDALFRNARMNKISFVAYVEGGAVEHTPSREDLEYTDHTKKTLQRVITEFENKILTESKAKIEKAATPQEAWSLWYEWGEKLGHDLFRGMEYQGKRFIHQFNVKDTVRYQVPNRGGYNARYNSYGIEHWDVKQDRHTLYVTEFQADREYAISVEASHKKKAREYFEHVGKDIKYVLFMKGTPDCEWISQDNVITWEDLKAACPKKVRVPGPPRPKRPKGLFDYYTLNGREFEKPIPDDADVFYITAQDSKQYAVVDAMRLAGADKDVVVVILAINRIDKFKRDNFGVREFVEWAKKKVVIDGESLLDDRSKIAMNLSEHTVSWLQKLPVENIIDPKWKLCKELLEYRKYSDKYDKNLELARCLGMRYDVKEYHAAKSDSSVTDKYPLLVKLSVWQMEQPYKDEVVKYINAAYAAMKGKP